MLACIDGWDEQLRHIVQSITPDCLIDHKLLWRDPVPQWVSRDGRICIVGDAAHPHLATSGTGAAQAIEDGACIAALLQKTGRDDIPLAFQAYQKLRCIPQILAISKDERKLIGMAQIRTNQSHPEDGMGDKACMASDGLGSRRC